MQTEKSTIKFEVEQDEFRRLKAAKAQNAENSTDGWRDFIIQACHEAGYLPLNP